VKPYVIWFALICVPPAFVGVACSADEKEKAATDAVAQWLTVVDSGQYGESWFQASGIFRGAVLTNTTNRTGASDAAEV
jgi:hypothetical protein